jgi:hypothetical protein
MKYLGLGHGIKFWPNGGGETDFLFIFSISVKSVV